MWLPARLRNALESIETAQNLQVEVQELRAAVAALEAVQLDREVQWTETKDQVLRHLKRVQAIRQHQEEADKPDNGLVARVLASKFPRSGGA